MGNSLHFSRLLYKYTISLIVELLIFEYQEEKK